jgi:hypothetical protein
MYSLNPAEHHIYFVFHDNMLSLFLLFALGKYQACFIKDNVYRVAYYDTILKDIGDALNLCLNRKYLRTGEIRKLVADSKKII